MCGMTQSHVALAIGHLEAVAATRDHLRDLYDMSRGARNAGPEHGANIAEAHQAIGYGLKAASIHADIAQAIALESVAKHLGPSSRPSMVTL